MEERWRVDDTADYICSRNFAVVTLQFPDAYLQHAASVCKAVQAACASRGHAIQAYILADTTYNSLSVDEVAAAHVGAQCVVHYGRASLTKLSRLPAFFVFPEQQLDVGAAAACLAGSSLLTGGGSGPVLVFLDQPLLHQLAQLRQALTQLVQRQQGAAAGQRLVFPAVPRQHMEPAQRGPPLPSPGGCGGGACGAGPPAAPQQSPPGQAACRGSGAGCSPPRSRGSGVEQAAAPASDAVGGDQSNAGPHSLAGYEWRLPEGAAMRDCALAWVGAQDAPALLQLQLTHSSRPWAVLDPSLLPTAGTGGSSGALTEGLPLDISRALRRRYYLVQKARDAAVVGILVGTLGAAGYGEAVEALRSAAAAAGKKTYTLLMGKPSPAKLANFPEIEVFVLVADPQGQILDSKEYLAPIITPHEAQLAFAPGEAAWDEARYRLDFDGVLQQAAGGAAAPAASRSQEPRFSLLAGGYTGGGGSGSDSEGEGEVAGGAASLALAQHAQQALQVSAAPGGRSDLVQPRSAADYLLHKRSWQGVETPLVGAAEKAVAAAVEGRSGRAAAYGDEPGQARR